MNTLYQYWLYICIGLFLNTGGDILDLIIVRHGRAEDISQKPEGGDFSRALTDEGVIQVRTMAIILNDILKYQNYKLISIVASSSERTMQTAYNIADILKTDEVISYDNLYHGDYFNLIPDIVSSNSDSDCIILVGHNPNVYFLTSSLCDTNLEFKKGSLACIRLNEDCTSGTLKYFISSDMIDKKIKLEGNISDFKRKANPGIDISDIKFEIDEFADNFYESCEDFKTDPSEPENIHKMRLSIRKILTLVDFSKNDLSDYSFKHVCKSLRSLNSELSIIRDLDQFIFYVHQIANSSHFEKMAISQRKEHENDILYKLNTSTFHDVYDILSSLVWINKNETLKDVNAYIFNLMCKIKKRRKKLCLDNFEKLHNTRLMGKKIKNMIEIFPDGVKDRTLLIEKDIKKIVNILGNINDHNNSLKILEILKKLSTEPDLKINEEISIEYQLLESHFKKLRKDEFRKNKKT